MVRYDWLTRMVLAPEGSGGGGNSSPGEADPAAGAAQGESDAAPPEQAAQDEQGDTQSGADTTTGGDSPEETPWYHKRIGTLTQQKAKKDQEIAELRAQLAELQVKQTPAGQQGAGRTYTEQELQLEADRRAEAKAAVIEFNRQCDNVYNQGVSTYGDDFQKKVDTLRASVEMTVDFMNQALATGNAKDIIYALGSDPAKAQKIMSMEPNARAIELAKMSITLGAPKAPSKAPPPIGTKVGANGNNFDGDLTGEEPIDVWMAKRNKQVESQKGARR